MRDLCNTDKPLFAVLTKLTYSAYLNILWLVQPAHRYHRSFYDRNCSTSRSKWRKIGTMV